MQNHPFIPRHACLAAISCPPTPPAALCLSLPPPLFCPRCILITRTCFPSLAARPREICLSISRQPRVNQHPLTPVLPGCPRHTFFPYHFCKNFRIRSSFSFSSLLLASHVQVFDRDETAGRKGDDPHFSEVTPRCGQAG